MCPRGAEGVPGTQSIGVYGVTWGASRCREDREGFPKLSQVRRPRRYGLSCISIRRENPRCGGIGEPTVDKTDPGWRITPWAW